MKQAKAFEILSAYAQKHDALIVADIGSQSLWLKAAGDRDENLYLSGPMGMASSVALGVATANKDRLVIAACGDGALGMNMTSLATISHAKPSNLIVMVLDNGIYEYTKSLPVPALGVDWTKISQTYTGFEHNVDLADIDTLDIKNGPHFVHAPIEGGELPPGPGIHPVDVHHRFKRLLSDENTGQNKTKQEC